MRSGLLVAGVLSPRLPFWPAVADPAPELALAAIVYLLVLLVGAWIFNAWRRTRRQING
jgi:hypothetical protein